MPGRTIYLSENPNDFVWTIPKGMGRTFEDLIQKYLKKYVATRDGCVKVIRTRASGDAGRDFEVHFSGEVEIFGIPVSSRSENSVGVAFIECKSTEHEKLSDEFIVDASQHCHSEACLYILVTNAVLTPYSQYRAQLEWERRNITFCVVDRRRLIEQLYTANLVDEAERLGISLPDPSKLPHYDRKNLIVSCQTEQKILMGKHLAHLYLSMANHGSESILSEISIATDVRWSAENTRHERVITPGHVETISLTVDRQEFNRPADLDLTLCVNGRSQRLAVSCPNYNVIFEPPFIGSTHRRVAQEVRVCAESSVGLSLISIHGEAGVGKTRTIKEALAPLVDGQFESFTYHFSSQQELPLFEDFFNTFGFRGNRHSVSDSSSRLTNVIESAAKADMPILIHFEDLHHADDSIIKLFKQIVLEPPNCTAPLIIIVTGRDDHTFPNEEYYSFLQLVSDQTIKNVYSYKILPLTDEDAKTLIRSVVLNIPEVGVDRVYTLGQNNPFIIIEILQYLLDTRLAQLLSRRTIGILNPEVFAGKQGLPETVEEIYDRRLASLENSPHGQLAFEFLIVASFFGFIVGPEIREAFFDEEGIEDACWTLLCERRFIYENPLNRESTFAHENLLHHIRRVTRQSEKAKPSAAQILRRPKIAKRLNVIDLGEVYYMSQNYSKAFELFSEIWECIQKISNFSSEEIDKRYFRYLPPLFYTAKAVNKPKDDLAKIALAHSYMGVHNYPLMMAENACAISSGMLNEIYPIEGDGLRHKLAVYQLRAHALQNMGHTGQALKEMLEIEAILREDNLNWPEVEYDLYDRLQEYYRKSNHEKLVRFYGRQAKKSVERAKDEKLLASHQITQSLVCLFSGERDARRQAAEAYRLSKRLGIRRFIMYTRLTELIVETLYCHKNPIVLKAVRDEARSMLREAAIAGFSDSIMRLELLLGTLALNCSENLQERHSLSRLYIESGQANSIRFGNGLFDWAFDNLAAVIDLEDQIRSDEDVRRRFRSCLERLRKRGLNFLGTQSGIYPNSFAISNIVRFFGQFQESIGVELIQSAISTYDNRFLEEEYISLDLVKKAVKGQPIFWPQKSKFHMIRYPPNNGYFTPVF